MQEHYRELSMHDFSNVHIYMHVQMHKILAKTVFVCLTTTFGFRNPCTIHVEHIPYMFAENSAFTSLNTVNIYVVTLPEFIPCMSLATYIYTNVLVYTFREKLCFCVLTYYFPLHKSMYITCRARSMHVWREQCSRKLKNC